MANVSTLRQQYSHETPTQAAARQAALRGAVSAFPGHPSRSGDGPKSSNGSGAVNAAASAGRAAADTQRQRPLAKSSHLSSASYGAVAAHRRSQEALQLQQGLKASAEYSHGSTDRQRSASPSNIAAMLAAARHSPRPEQRPQSLNTRPQSTLRSISYEQAKLDQEPSPTGTVTDVRSWLQHLEGGKEEQKSAHDNPRLPQNDGVYTPAQRQRVPSLERLRKEASTQQLKKPVASAVEIKSRPPEIVSPRPVRAMSISGSMRALSSTDGAHEVAEPSTGTGASVLREEEVFRGLKHATSREGQGVQNDTAMTDITPISKVDAAVAVLSQQTAKEHKPTAPPPRRSRTQTQVHTKAAETMATAPAAESRITTRNAQPVERPRSASPPMLPRRESSVPIPIPKRGFTTSTATSSPRPIPAGRKISAHMTSDSLANAIVASSLASSRAPSPIKPILPHRPTHTHNQTLHHLRHPASIPHLSQLSQHSPSPPKTAPITMRQTMRPPRRSSDSDSDDDHTHKKHRKFLIRKHPNKHHEGDRKRWRDEVTERERKRYEGVWAANRGLHVPVPAHLSHADNAAASAAAAELKNSVSGLVVRDIWRRSRLPDMVLEEVWALVCTDSEGKARGCLGRSEFVVGMWLVDQRLKGRKLPVRVGASVWRSVRGMRGIVLQQY